MTIFNFNEQEMVKFLEKRGYTIVEETVTIGIPIYHNDVEYSDRQILMVYKNGINLKDSVPTGYYISKDTYVREIFNKEMRTALLSL